MQTIKHTFTGGINADDSAELISDKVYLNAENMRLGISLFGEFGRMESIESNRLIANTIAPAGTNTPIGRCVDTVRDRCFAMFFNSLGNHFIAVLQADETVLLVIREQDTTEGLKFDLTKQIHSIEANGDLLYWVEDGEPFRLNVEAALKATNPGYVTNVLPYTFPINYTVQTVIRKPPNLPVTASWVIDTTISVNQIADHGFRFCYWYEYRDGEISTLSMQSTLVPALYKEGLAFLKAIDIIIPFAEKIEQDVLCVVLGVVYATEDKAFEIKRWDRRSSTDALAISQHNAGAVRLLYHFSNSTIGPGVDVASKNKLFDFVWPCRTLELAKNRLHLANMAEGYDTPRQSSLVFSLAPSPPDETTAILKTDSSYVGAMCFYDRFMRQCGASESPLAFVRTPPRGGDPFQSGYSGITWTVSNTNAAAQIMPEAYFYAPLMSKNLRTDFFIEARASDVKYASYTTSGTYTLTNTNPTAPNLSGIAVNMDAIPKHGMGYTFQPGDVARYVSLSNYFESPVKAVQGSWIILEYVNIGDLALQTKPFIEIYTPLQNSVDNLYYEVGKMYPVLNPGTVNRSYTTLTGILPGDVFAIARADDPANPGDNYATENMNPNDKVWREWNTSHGRPQQVDRIGRQVIPTGQRWSNIYLNGTAVNGLSSFDVIDQKILPATIGPIRRLVLTNKVQEEGSVMLAIGEKQIESEYLGETQVVESTQTAFFASSPQTVGTTQNLRLSTGTRHPETVQEKDGNVFGYDVTQGLVWQYSRGGLVDISEYKLKQQWLAWSKQYPSGGPAIPSGINEYNSEYQLSLPPLTSIGGYPWVFLDGAAKVVAFNYKYNVWVGGNKYQPQQLFYLNKKFYNITDSFFRCHDVAGSNVILDGVTQPCRLMFISTGGNFDRTKIWETLALIAKQAPDNVLAQNYLPYEQYTTLLKEEFEMVEGKHYASWRLNQNDDTMTANEALLDGENMRSQVLYIMLEWGMLDGVPTKQNRIFVNSVHLGIQLSSGHTI